FRHDRTLFPPGVASLESPRGRPGGYPHRHPRFDEFERGASDLLLLLEVAFGGEVEIELLRTRPAAQGRPAVDLIEPVLRREALQVPADRHAGEGEGLGAGRARGRSPR